jgi:hypothetical protein
LTPSFSFLSGAFLWSTNFIGADLRTSNLTGVTSPRVELNNAALCEENLRGADLKLARLVNTNLVRADITGAQLFGTVRDYWEIDGIKCDYIYWDLNGKNRTPKSRNFKQGEFEELYKSLPTIEYFFENGFTPLDTVLMDQIVQSINKRNPEFELKLDSFHSRGKGRAVFTVLHKEIADEALALIRSDYENRIAVITAKYESVYDCYENLIRNLPVGDTYHIHDQATVVGRGSKVHVINFNQIWNDIGQDIDLNQLAEELSQLRSRAKKAAHIPDNLVVVKEIEAAEIAAKEGKGAKLLQHLKKAGLCALEVSKDIGTALATEVIKKSMGL